MDTYTTQNMQYLNHKVSAQTDKETCNVFKNETLSHFSSLIDTVVLGIYLNALNEIK